MKGSARQFRISVRGEVGDLAEERGVQSVDGELQALHGLNQGLNGGAFSMEGEVTTGDVILDQLLNVAVMVLIGDVLAGGEIELRLIESAA